MLIRQREVILVQIERESLTIEQGVIACIDERSLKRMGDRIPRREIPRSQPGETHGGGPAGADVTGDLVALLYEHGIRGLSGKRVGLGGSHHGAIVAGMCVHLDHDEQLRGVVRRSRVDELHRLAESLMGVHGVSWRRGLGGCSS